MKKMLLRKTTSRKRNRNGFAFIIKCSSLGEVEQLATWRTNVQPSQSLPDLSICPTSGLLQLHTLSVGS